MAAPANTENSTLPQASHYILPQVRQWKHLFQQLNGEMRNNLNT